MKKKKLFFASLVPALLLTGCESMMERMWTHYVLPEGAVSQVAMLNAAVNVCLANKAIDKNVAYAFSSVGAQYLDVGVFDKSFYKKTYQDTIEKITTMTGLPEGCAKIEGELPRITQQYADSYMKMSTDLAITRAQERQQMAAMLNNFGKSWGPQNYPETYSWPKVNFVETEPSSNSLYMVNTSKGLVQCRTTNKSYVFCM